MKDNESKTPQGEAPKLEKLNINGDIYLTNYTRKYENRKPWSKPSKKQVISFIPGTIRQILVKEGETVKADQKLLILEAMKMMNTIYSPISGKIKSILVHEGDCLPNGTLMIEFA